MAQISVSSADELQIDVREEIDALLYIQPGNGDDTRRLMNMLWLRSINFPKHLLSRNFGCIKLQLRHNQVRWKFYS